VFVWTWLLAASPQLGPLVLAELVDAWLWTITSRRGLFADGAENSGPAAFLCPQLVAGESKPPPAQDPTESIAVHRVWLGFLLDRFEVSMYKMVLNHSHLFCMGFTTIMTKNLYGSCLIQIHL
jgi:phosphatidylinositol 4-kinase